MLLLSPHRDDAAFSCGLFLSALCLRNVTARVVNVCTISDYAPYADPTSAGDVESISRLRADEDEAFLDCLRETARPATTTLDMIDLRWKDAPIRLAMPTENVLDARAVPQPEVAVLASQFRDLPAASVVVAPLALGGHIDHRLVRDAATLVWDRSQLLFYEDLPYACRIADGERARATQNSLPWPCVAWQTASAEPGLKRKLASCYGSQIEASVAEEMEGYGAARSFRETLYGRPDGLGRIASMLHLDIRA